MPLNIKNHRELIALAEQGKISVETLATFYEIAVDQLEKLTPIKTDDRYIPATYEKVSSPVGIMEDSPELDIHLYDSYSVGFTKCGINLRIRTTKFPHDVTSDVSKITCSNCNNSYIRDMQK